METIPPEAHLSLSIPRYAKEWYLHSLENFAMNYNLIKRYEMVVRCLRTPKEAARTFHYFNKLPIELRVKIWAYAFTSHLEPRIHCIKEFSYSSRSAFLSNQPISPLLQVCAESRTLYISETKTVCNRISFIFPEADTNPMLCDMRNKLFSCHMNEY